MRTNRQLLLVGLGIALCAFALALFPEASADIGYSQGGGAFQAGTLLVATSDITSSAVPNNTQTAPLTTAAAGAVALVDLVYDCDGTGLAGPLNVEFSANPDLGAYQDAATPFWTVATAGMGVDASGGFWDGMTITTRIVRLETGDRLFVHGDNLAGSGAGVCRITMVFMRLVSGAGVTGVDVAPVP